MFLQVQPYIIWTNKTVSHKGHATNQSPNTQEPGFGKQFWILGNRLDKWHSLEEAEGRAHG